MSVVSRTQPGDRGGSCVVTHAATCCRVRRHATPCDGVRRCTSSPPILPPPRCCDLAPSSCFVFLIGLRSSGSRSSSLFLAQHPRGFGFSPCCCTSVPARHYVSRQVGTVRERHEVSSGRPTQVPTHPDGTRFGTVLRRRGPS